MMGGGWVWSRLGPAEEQGLFSCGYVSGMAGRLGALEWAEVWVGGTQGIVGWETDKTVGSKESLSFSGFVTQLRPMGSDPLQPPLLASLTVSQWEAL